MGAVSAKELWSKWEKGEVQVEHSMGQALQILVEQHKTINKHGIALTWQQEEIARLSLEVRKLHKEMDALKKALEEK